MYKYFIKPLLFLFPPDYVHAVVVKFSSLIFRFSFIRNIVSYFFVFKHQSLEKEILGIKFNNPVGLGGGFDKDSELIQCIGCLGFGFMEVGSVTNKPYRGNLKPWNTRLPKDKSIIVNYGLKNKGAKHAFFKLSNTPRSIPVIVNIAKTNNSKIKGRDTVLDYLATFKKLQSVADLVTINISCPNSGDGILLCKDMAMLKELLVGLQKLHDNSDAKKPILLKIKVDLSDEQLNNILRLTGDYSCIKGFVVANLSDNRKLLKNTDPNKVSMFPGGISGQPIKDLSNNLIRKIRLFSGSKYVIIGIGGIFNATDAFDKLQAGADLVELVTGLIYEGPAIAKKINQGLIKKF